MHFVVTQHDTFMRFTIEIGRDERHRLDYHFNQFIGRLVVKVDNHPVRQSLRLVNEPVKEVFEFEIGQYEKQAVRIEKLRKPLLGHRNRVFVNNRLVKVVGHD